MMISVIIWFTFKSPECHKSLASIKCHLKLNYLSCLLTWHHIFLFVFVYWQFI